MNSPGTLFLVATPIGNLEDLSPRARRILGEVSIVAAEDTRRTGRLLAGLGLSTPLISCFDHNEEARAHELQRILATGRHVALVSSAGSPLISDPGYRVVREAVAAGASVVAVPGPSAALLALQLSGLSCDRFAVFGFIPKKGARRRAFLEAALSFEGSVVCFVPARDTASLLDEAARHGSPGEVRVAVCRELTKRHEEVLRGAAVEVARVIDARVKSDSKSWRGEVTVVLQADEPPTTTSDDELRQRLALELSLGATRREALARVREATGTPRAKLYLLLDSLKKEDKSRGTAPPSGETDD